MTRARFVMATSSAMSGQVAPHQAPHAPKKSNDNPIAGGTGKLSYFIGSFVIHVTQSCWKEKIQ